MVELGVEQLKCEENSMGPTFSYAMPIQGPSLEGAGAKM